MAKKTVDKRRRRGTASLKKEYSFPTKSRCPRCKGTSTHCRRTDADKGLQYRICDNPVCRHKYMMRGQAV